MTLVSGGFQIDRAVELLIDRAVYGLTEGERAELEALTARGGPALEAGGFELAAAAAQLAMVASPLEMPGRLRRRLEAAANEFIAARERERAGGAAVLGSIGAEAGAGRGVWRRGPARLGWVAAAACLVLAVGAWWPRLAGTGPSSPVGARRAVVESAPDVVRLAWGDFNSLDEREEPPEIRGVRGEVVWSDSLQEGCISFANLPVNDPAKERYQLWIVDEQRGLGQRVDGGLFDVARPGTCTVPFSGKLRVARAIGFAVTIEEPDGVVVSDLSRRVVLGLRS